MMSDEWRRCELRKGIEKFNALIACENDIFLGILSDKEIQILLKNAEKHFKNVSERTDNKNLETYCKEAMYYISNYGDLIINKDYNNMKIFAKQFPALCVKIYNDPYLDM